VQVTLIDKLDAGKKVCPVSNCGYLVTLQNGQPVDDSKFDPTLPSCTFNLVATNPLGLLGKNLKAGTSFTGNFQIASSSSIDIVPEIGKQNFGADFNDFECNAGHTAKGRAKKLTLADVKTALGQKATISILSDADSIEPLYLPGELEGQKLHLVDLHNGSFRIRLGVDDQCFTPSGNRKCGSGGDQDFKMLPDSNGVTFSLQNSRGQCVNFTDGLQMDACGKAPYLQDKFRRPDSMGKSYTVTCTAKPYWSSVPITASASGSSNDTWRAALANVEKNCHAAFASRPLIHYYASGPNYHECDLDISYSDIRFDVK
jgi:hypothetical protein